MASLYRGIDDNWRIEQLQTLSQENRLAAGGSGRCALPSPRPVAAARLPDRDQTQNDRGFRRRLAASQRRAAFANGPAATSSFRPHSRRASSERSKLPTSAISVLASCVTSIPKSLPPTGKTPIQYLAELTQHGCRSKVSRRRSCQSPPANRTRTETDR